MPASTPPQFFGCSKQQLRGHSARCFERFSHDGRAHLEEEPYDSINKYFPSDEIDLEHFINVLAAFRFFPIHPPPEFLRSVLTSHRSQFVAMISCFP
ncbi:hypothetical protein C8Q75DRAFT_576452 [Abortiporus biennis]|nr:hypothetical protein C8Q75DRAFT_576324 [Abortiporus biennis]KAI0792678.1 hypothetical protein C8Q75DRAFT_576452 [Abortiporus biennis]